jgi:hypothetical protein
VPASRAPPAGAPALVAARARGGVGVSRPGVGLGAAKTENQKSWRPGTAGGDVRLPDFEAPDSRQPMLRRSTPSLLCVS